MKISQPFDLQYIMANLPGSIYWKDRKGVYLGCNIECSKIVGLASPDEIIGKDDFDIIKLMGESISVAEEIRRIDEKVMCTGQAILDELTPAFKTADGRVLKQLTSKVPLKSSHGDVIGVLGVSQDISQLRATLSEQNFLLNRILEFIPGSIYWMNKEEVYLGCNDYAARMAGFNSSDDIIGKTIYEIGKDLGWDDEVINKFSSDDKSILETGVSILNQEEPPFKDALGNTIVQLSNRAPIRDENGNITGLVGVSLDITDRKKFEEIQNQTIGMENSMANIAHELRTPLTTITNFAHGIESMLPKLIETYRKATDAGLDVPEVGSKKIKNAISSLSEINRVAKRSLDIIDMILKMQRTGVNPNILKPCSMEQCVKSAIETYAYPDLKDQAKIHWTQGKDFTFEGDQELMVNVLFNLIRNALWYTSAGGDITIEILPGKHNNKLIFKDTGQGIKPDHLPHIFDKFYSKRVNGTGIGLTFCKSTIEEFGGTIACHSVFGEYTEFILMFPKVVS